MSLGIPGLFFWSLLGASGLAPQSEEPPQQQEKPAEKAKEPSQAEVVSVRSSGQVLVILHRTNVFEMIAARLGMDRANQQIVRDYARRLYEDHRENERRVQQLADQLGFDLPAAAPAQGEEGRRTTGIDVLPADEASMEMTPPQQEMLAALRNVDASRFDWTFTVRQIGAHTQAISTFDYLLPRIPDEQVRKLVEETLPVLKSHEETGLGIRKKLSAETTR